jgi:HEPN domain-containing protein
VQNKKLIQDYLTRGANRYQALELLFRLESYADVVRESQELVELCLKAILRSAGIEPPRLHDLSDVLLEHVSRFPKPFEGHVKKMAKISHTLRRDRELSFYGSEDLTPSEFYSQADAVEARDNAAYVLKWSQQLAAGKAKQK